MLSQAGSVGDAVPSSDWGNALARLTGSLRGGGVMLPHLPYSSVLPPSATAGDASSGPRTGDFDAAATVAAFRTLNEIGRAYPMAVVKQPPANPAPILSCAHILAVPPATMGTGSPRAESARFRLLWRHPNPPATPDLGEFELRRTTRPPAISARTPPLCPSWSRCCFQVNRFFAVPSVAAGPFRPGGATRRTAPGARLRSAHQGVPWRQRTIPA